MPSILRVAPMTLLGLLLLWVPALPAEVPSTGSAGSAGIGATAANSEAAANQQRSFVPAANNHWGAEHGSLSYTARVVHNDRQYLSHVRGSIDLASGDFVEETTHSYILDFKVMPGKLQAAPQAMPTIWQVGGMPAQRFGSVADANSLPSFGSALLRHFIIGQVVAAPQSIKPGTCYIAQQLEIDTVQLDPGGFEIVGRYRGGPLVIVGSRQEINGRRLPKDLAVLGPTGELYQYFFEDISYSAAAPEPRIALPSFDAADYVNFPAGESEGVPIRSVKDWLVFQASLPSGRQLNLLLDSGADTMIVDDLVLELDARLTPAGETTMEGAVNSSRMKLYKDFAFNVGGVEFKNLSVVGGTITNIAFGAGMRIHGVVGSEVLQLCRLDLDLDHGQMRLLPADNSTTPAGQPLPLTFINDFPHVEAEVAGKGKALMLLDTGQRSPVSVNLDALQDYKLDDELVMDGFLGDIGGSLLPRYMLEKLDLTLGGQTYEEKTVDAAPEGTYHFEGVPVIGSIGFSLLARHFGGLTFDYRNKYLYVREPSDEREFRPSAEAWAAWQTRNYDPATLARKLSSRTQATGYELLAQQKSADSAGENAAAASTDPVEQLLAQAGLESGIETGKENGQESGAPGSGDSGGGPAFRISGAEQKKQPRPDKPTTDVPEEITDPDGGSLEQNAVPLGEKLPPMRLKDPGRRFGGDSATDINATEPDTGVTAISSGEMWGGLVAPAESSLDDMRSDSAGNESGGGWLDALRTAAGAIAIAIRLALPADL